MGALLPLAPARAQNEARLGSVEIVGRLIDDKQRLLAFLGLAPGMIFDEAVAQRMGDDLSKQLGYRLKSYTTDPGPNGLVLKLVIEPMRMVRNVLVHGNWPLFDDDIYRHLTVRSGSRLVEDSKLAEFLAGEADRVRKYLESDGYFTNKVNIVPRQGPREDWIDLDVDIELGEWFRLGEVVAEGNQAITTQELFEQFDHCCLRWGRFQLERMREDTRAAEKTLRDRGYPAARILPTFNIATDSDPQTRRLRLPVKVIEKRKVHVKFVGNHSIGDLELHEQLTLFSSGAYDEIELQESARALQRDYQKHGFFEARVTFQRRRESATSNIEDITFLVVEGPELKVRGIDVVSESGEALRFSAEEVKVKAQIETRVFPRLGLVGLGEGGYVTTLQLQQDADRIADWYRSRGFPQVKVRAEVARDPASFAALGALGAETAGGLEGKNDLYVRFFVEQGRQELVDHLEVSFHGEHGKSEKEVLKVMKLGNGQPYTDQALRDDQQHISELYKSSGHPYVVATFGELKEDTRVIFGGSTWNATHERIVLRVLIDEGEPVRFGEILIRGNFKTHDRVILMDLPFKPGDPFDFNKLDRGERNLQTHLIFTSARVVPVGLREAPHRNPVPILVTVQERYLERFGSAAVAAGVATDKLPNYVYVSAGWIWSNFAGFGSQLELRGDFGFSTESWGVSARYTDIRVFGPGWRYDLTGFYRQELTIRLGPVTTFGASTALTRFLTPTLRLYLRYDIYESQISAPFVRIDGPHDISTQLDQTVTAKVTAGLIWDRRIGFDGLPNPLMPVKGWLLAAGAGWATPYLGSDHQYVLVFGQALALVPFKIRSAEFTLIANLRYDEGIPIGESALPVVDRYFAGGDTTTRGYDPDTLKSEIIRSDVSPLSGGPAFRVVPQGGNIRLLNTVEIQFPIAKTFLGLPWPWVGSLFWDMGAISDAPNLLRGSDFKHAIGVSVLRILTPVGPLSLEYAYPLTQTLAEERWKTNPWYSHFPGRIHFNWGIPLSRL